MHFLFALFLLLLGVTTAFSNTGLAITTNLVSGIGGTVPKYIGWGTGSGAAAKADTDLFTPAAESRVAGTVTRTTTTAANDTLQVVGTIVSLSAQTITNAGIFDAAGAGNPPSGGNIYMKSSFAGLPLAAGDSIQFTWTMQYS